MGVGIAGLKTALKGPATTPENELETRMGGNTWEAFGSGRQPGEVGRPVTRGWRWNSGFNSGSTGGGFNSGSTEGPLSNRPPAHDPDWEYPSSTSRPAYGSGTGKQGFNPGSGSGSGSGWGSSQGGFRPGITARSSFSKQYVRMIKSPSSAVAGPVKKTPPFLTDEIEIIVPVEACKENDFEMTIISPQNTQLGKITDIHLPVLADIPDYIPPEFTSVLQISLLGGKPNIAVTRNSPIPDTCVPEYLEAMDAFANRLEAVANTHNKDLKQRKSHQDNVQDMVEMTQAESLH